jgi:predicted dehydrogenase
VESVTLAATGGIGADVVLLCAGTASSEPANTALRIVRQRGRVVVVGAVGMNLDRNPFYQKEVEFTISCSYGPGRYDASYEEGGVDYPVGFVRWTENRNLAAFLELVSGGRVDADGLVAAEHPLADAPAAFDAAKSPHGAGVAVVLRYPGRDGATARTIERRVGTTASRAPKTGAVGVAVLGAGGFAASTLLPALAAVPGVRLRAVAARTSATAAKVAQEFGAEVSSTDARAVLADPAVDAVVIATRHDLHAPLAREALAAGKHVFLEKPMGLTHAEVDGLRDAALASGLVFTVGYNRRYAPLSIRVADVMAATPGPRAVVYRVNAGHLAPGAWPLDPRLGGGRIVGELCHMLDLLAFWLGPELESWSAAAVPSKDAAAPSPQEVVVALCFRDRARETHVASLVYTSLGARDLPKERIEVHMGRGSLVLEDFASLESFGLRVKGARLKRPDKGHRDELRYFVEAIRGGSTPLLGPYEAHFATDLALQIDTAVRGL